MDSFFQQIVKKAIFALSLFSLIFILASCNSKDNSSTNNEPTTTESSDNSNDDNSNSDKQEESSDDENKSGVELGDNPGDEGYTWGPGEH